MVCSTSPVAVIFLLHVTVPVRCTSMNWLTKMFRLYVKRPYWLLRAPKQTGELLSLTQRGQVVAEASLDNSTVAIMEIKMNLNSIMMSLESADLS